MAQVNLARRAEIGLAKRNRTRAAILEAARACYAAPKAAPVTVDAVMQAAGLAKGTFYVHFADLGALEGALGEALTEELDRRLQPARLAADHPLTRAATALTVLLRDLARSPAQARLVARAAAEIPDVATPCRRTCPGLGGSARRRLWQCRRSNGPASDAIGRMPRRISPTPDRRWPRLPDIVSAILRASAHPREAARHPEAAERLAAALRADR